MTQKLPANNLPIYYKQTKAQLFPPRFSKNWQISVATASTFNIANIGIKLALYLSNFDRNLMQVMHKICSSVYFSKVTNYLMAVPHRVFSLIFRQTFWRPSVQNLHYLLIQYWPKCDKK